MMIIKLLEEGKKPKWSEDIESKDEKRYKNLELARKLKAKGV